MRIVPDNPEQAAQEQELSLALWNEYMASHRGTIDITCT